MGTNNQSYICDTGHCCGQSQCCNYYYELWCKSLPGDVLASQGLGYRLCSLGNHSLVSPFLILLVAVLVSRICFQVLEAVSL